LNGYRYHASEQLPRLNRILVLTNLGFSFEQVSLLLDGTCQWCRYGRC
jgi:DNA-binding transcriptional MerR regulator